MCVFSISVFIKILHVILELTCVLEIIYILSSDTLQIFSSLLTEPSKLVVCWNFATVDT
jgi:hypothetical protein